MSMSTVIASIEVGTPLDDVWAYASDWRLWDEWWDGVSSFHPTTEVERGNGARYAYRAWIAGVWLNLETEVDEFVEKVGWRGTVTKGPPHRTQWLFESTPAGTRLTYTLEYSLPIPLVGRLLDSCLMRPGWQRRLDSSLGKLKQHFEAAPSGGQGAAR